MQYADRLKAEFIRGGYTEVDEHLGVFTYEKVGEALSYRFKFDDTSLKVFGRITRLSDQMSIAYEIPSDCVLSRGFKWAQRRLREILYDNCRYV